ncbi:hypothetical protein GC174_07825 [bacterium]|nr:hypothetical protein [bacterium]
MLVLSMFLLSGAPALARGKARQDGSRPNRVTVGTVEIKGWQHDIVKSYPNLKNYHWNPMYANVQGMNMVRPTRHSVKGKAKGPQKQDPKQKTVNKIANQYVRYRPVQSKPAYVTYQRPKSVYKKPVHLPARMPAAQNDANTNTGTGTNIGLDQKKTTIGMRTGKQTNNIEGQLYHKKTEIALGSPSTAANLMEKRAEASLAAPQVEAALGAPVTTLRYKPYKSGGGGYIVESNSGNSNTRVQGRVNW